MARRISINILWQALTLFCASAYAFPENESEQFLESTVYRQLQRRLSAIHGRYNQLVRETADLEGRVVDIAQISEGRLTVLSGDPAPTADQTNQTTLYFTPYKGNKVSLYNGATWTVYSFSEIALSLASLSANTNYDVFVFDSAGTLTLELTAWASNIARATSLVLQDGIYVRNGATTRRYLGTIRATASNQTQDSATQRFVWNYQNRLRRRIAVLESTNTWTYNSDVWRATNGSTSNRMEFVVGINDSVAEVKGLSIITNGTGTLNYYSSGVGLDTTTNVSSSIRGSGSSSTMVNQVWSEYRGYPPIGYHYLQWVERAHASTITVWGDNGDSTRYQSGVQGLIDG